MPSPVWHAGSYWLRKRVPADIRATYSKNEEWESLGTKDIAVARKRLPAAMLAVETLFEAHRQGLRAAHDVVLPVERALPLSKDGKWFADLAEMCRYFHDEVLEEGTAEQRLEKTELAFANCGEFWDGKILPLCPDSRQDAIAFALADAYRHADKRMLETLRVSLVIREFSFQQLLYSSHFIGELEIVHLIALTRTHIKFLEDQLADAGALYPTMAELVDRAAKEHEVQATSTQPNTDTDPILTDAVGVWIAQRTDFSQERVDEMYTSVHLLIETVGDRPISTYGKDDVRALRSVLSSLPRHHRKIKETRELSALDAVARGKELGLPTLHPSTRNDYLGRLSHFFDWAVASYNSVSFNPFGSKSVRFPDSSSAREGRDPFTGDELTTLFSSSDFTSLQRDLAKFWVPVLLLFTGCRSNEILKLKVSDIRNEDGIDFIDINEEAHLDARVWTRVKMGGANVRRVPIHRELVAIGFLTFVERRRRDGSERLFPELRYNKKGKFSDAFGKWFHRLLKRVGIKRPKIDAHSLRHNFADACDSSRIHQDYALMLKDGPGSKKKTLARYGHGKTDIEILAEEMAKLKYKGLDLSHLHLRKSASGSSRAVSVNA